MVTFKTIPKGMRIESQVGTELILAPIRRSRKKFKFSAKRRQAISTAAKRMKLPVLTLAAVGIPTLLALEKAGGLNRLATRRGAQVFASEMLASYTGILIRNISTFDFTPRLMLRGLVPLVMLTGIKRLGVFRGANRGLSQAKIPLRLN